jgi:hypothetical protein
VNFLSAPTGTPVIRGTLDGRETASLTVSVGGRIYRSTEGSVAIDRVVGRWSLPIPQGHRLPEGVYSVEAVAYNSLGNTAVDLTSDELLVGKSGSGSTPFGPPVPVSPEALTFMVHDSDPFSIDLSTLFTDPFQRPLSFMLAGMDNVQAGLEGSVLNLQFARNFNSHATIRIQVFSDPSDPSSNPVYAITIIYDADRDAIPDEVEAVPWDINRDGVEDAYQNAVATFPMRNFGSGAAAPLKDFTALIIGDHAPNRPAADGFGLVIDTPARINDLTVREASELGELPPGLVDISPVLRFSINTATPLPDGSIVATLVLYPSSVPDVVYKFGRRSPTDTAPSFYPFNWDGRTGGQFIDTDGDGKPNLLRMVYRDGERGDDDWKVNGVVVDPVFFATRDEVPPEAPRWTTESGTVTTPRPPLAGTAEPLSMVRVYLGALEIGAVRADESGRWVLRPTSDLPDGRHLFEATATDAARNVSSRSRFLDLLVQTQVVAVDDTLPRVPGKPMKIPVAFLLTNDFSGLGPLSVKQVDARSSRGGTLVLSRGWIVYTPPPGLPDDEVDSFGYTAHNGSVSANARIHLVGETWRVAPGRNLVRIIPLSVGVALQFSVIPGQRYRVSASDRIGAGEDWTPIGSVWSDQRGRLEIRDLDAIGTIRFYQIEEDP